jgi:hypothetical protein
MDDFLHNLRSGKLKQPDRSNRHFNDPQYKGAPRRNPMDRRKRDFDTNKDSTERLGAIKEVLETLAESQKRMADAYEARTRAEERKATAMEVLAKNLYRMLNPNAKDADALFAPAQQPEETDQLAPAEETEFFETAAEDIEPVEDYAEVSAEAKSSDIDNIGNQFEETEPDGRKLSKEERKRVCELAGRLRNEGNSWENIARQITAQGYSTISGKGTWRGVMIKNIYEKMGVEE